MGGPFGVAAPPRAGAAPVGYREGVSVLDVIGVFVVIPGVIVGVMALLTVGVGHHRARIRYRPGQAWDQPDQLWGGDIPVIAAAPADRVGTKVGGAHGTW